MKARMTKEEFERLEKDHKFYQAVVKFEPEQVTKQIKDFYKERSENFQHNKKSESDWTLLVTIILFLLAAIIVLLILSPYFSASAY
jgi:hypothetical protein